VSELQLRPAPKSVRWEDLLARLPAPRKIPGARNLIGLALAERNTRLLVVDDDPTGSQAVRDIAVLARWEDEDLRHALDPGATCVTFLLTNTRALDETEARRINAQIGARSARIAAELGADVRFISRGDSTLRGHFPAETDALIEGWEKEGGSAVDGIVLCPAFLEAGRVTVGDVHWVRQGELAVPAAETEFGRDATFGYTASRLQDWLAEQDARRAASAVSISIRDLRVGGPGCVAELLGAVGRGKIVVANAVDEADLDVLVLGLLAAERRGKRFVYRTAPSFVAARCGQVTGGTLRAHDIYAARREGHGLIVVGSHSQQTTRQLSIAIDRFALTEIELDVDVLVSAGRDREIARAGALVEQLLRDQPVVVSTSRNVRTEATPAASLELSRRVSGALVEVVRGLDEGLPIKFLIAKGGITSSDIVTRALGVRRATVLGQVFPGQVSVWRLDQRDGLPYVVFPGNVGSDEALADTLAILLEDEAT